jgi:hypothetical protein
MSPVARPASKTGESRGEEGGRQVAELSLRLILGSPPAPWQVRVGTPGYACLMLSEACRLSGSTVRGWSFIEKVKGVRAY